MSLQLQPDVLRAVFPLTRLELSGCRLLDGAQALAAAPGLQHLSVDRVYDKRGNPTFPTDVLSHLTKLTCLRLQRVDCRNMNSSSSSSDPSAALQPLQALTRLADLQLGPARERSMERFEVTADMLSGANQLTRLVVIMQLFEPRALAGKSQLQHLALRGGGYAPGTSLGGVAQLLSELQHLTQLTHLDLAANCGGWSDSGGPCPPLAAYASLTASSRLQHLYLASDTLPAAAWQYMCPPGRVLPQLPHLDISHVKEADTVSSALPDTSALVSCFPGLQSLKSSMPCSTAQLAPLQRLTGLHTLIVGGGYYDDLEGVQALCQLTGLQELDVETDIFAEAHPAADTANTPD